MDLFFINTLTDEELADYISEIKTQEPKLFAKLLTAILRARHERSTN